MMEATNGHTSYYSPILIIIHHHVPSFLEGPVAQVVADLLHEAEVGLVVHLLVALLAVGLVALVLLLGYAFRPQQPL